MADEQRKFELSVPQILGSALAAVTAAVAASYLGVAGTVIGAAVVSMASTIGTAIYTHYLKQTGERVKQHATTGRRLESPAPAAEAGADEPDAGGTTLVMPAIEQFRMRLPWVRVGAAAAAVFAVSMGGILLYQGITQQTVHEQLTGKTTKDRTEVDKEPAGRTGERSDPPAYAPQSATSAPRSPAPTPTVTVTETPAATQPSPTRTGTVSPTPTPTPTPAAPSPSPTVTAPPAEQPGVEDEAPPTGQPDRADPTDQAVTPAP
jgi:hypothetical protein